MTTTLSNDLALRLRIESLFADYVHCIDDDALEQWPDFFTKDALYRITSRENFTLGLPVCLVYCEGRGMMADRISAMRQANIYEPHSYNHNISALKILSVATDGIRTQSNFAVFRTMADGAMSLFNCGRYMDRIVEENGVLKFAERLVVLESRRIDTLLVIPV
jgi:anthranilate 1,2-dioxygenase small subunit